MTKTFHQDHTMRAVAPVAVMPAETFENQQEPIELRRMADIPDAFAGKENERLKKRLRKLRDELNAADLS